MATTFTVLAVADLVGVTVQAVAGTDFKAGMKILWDAQLLTPTGLTATACTVTPTKSATAKTVNVVAINYDGELEARSDAKTFTYSAAVRAADETEPEQPAKKSKTK
jgi:hypothetical protein